MTLMHADKNRFDLRASASSAFHIIEQAIGSVLIVRTCFAERFLTTKLQENRTLMPLIDADKNRFYLRASASSAFRIIEQAIGSVLIVRTC
jgi:hypothetical protein